MAQRIGNLLGREVPVKWREPARPNMPVNGLGALAGASPLALRLQIDIDALAHKVFRDRTTNGLCLRNANPFLESLQPYFKFIVEKETHTPTCGHRYERMPVSGSCQMGKV